MNKAITANAKSHLRQFEKLSHGRLQTTVVRAEFGQEIEVDVAGELPRWHRPLWCVGQMEREPGRLQLRFVLSGDEHVDDIVVVEDDESVVVLATVCASTAGPSGDALGVPCHVYLDRPLGGRVVIDGHRDEPVPYVNVYEEIRQEQAQRASASACDP
jgi:hypothetical protein